MPPIVHTRSFAAYTDTSVRPPPMKCSDTVTPFDDNPCPSDAVCIAWSDAPGFGKKQPLCAVHTRILERAIARFHPTSAFHTDPLDAAPHRDDPPT